MKDLSFHRFINVDTHKDQHTAAVIDCFNHCLGTIKVPNNPTCFDEFIRQAKVYTNDNQLSWGYRWSLPISGLPPPYYLRVLVKEINLTLTERRKKERHYPEKSDLQDALSTAKTLLSEFDSLPNVFNNKLCVAIRDLFLHRDSLVKEQTRLKNRFHSLIRK